MLAAEPDRDRIEEILARRVLHVPDVEAVRVRRSFPGISRETWFVDVREPGADDERPQRLVLRTDPPGGSLAPTPLAYEAEIYRRLHGTELPVPGMLWYEHDPDWLLDGREFFVREWVEGSLEPPAVRDGSAQERARVVQELVERLAALHACDWRALGFDELMDAPDSPEACARHDVERQVRILDERGLEPFPALREAVHWLLEHPPPPPERICLRKENNGLGEEVWDGDRIVALCDWETASLGDPALDLAIAMHTTGNRLWNLPDVLDHYESVSGTRIPAESIAYYGLCWALRNCVGLHTGLRGFAAGRDQRVQVATLGLHVHRAQDALARAAGF